MTLNVLLLKFPIIRRHLKFNAVLEKHLFCQDFKDFLNFMKALKITIKITFLIHLLLSPDFVLQV